MEQTGTLRVRVYTSNAQLPVEGASVVVTQKNPNGKYDLLSVQATNSSGEIRELKIPTPLSSASTSPERGRGQTNATCEIWAEAPGFVVLKVDGVQIFPDVVTEQQIELIPLEDGEHGLDRVKERQISAQNL